MVVMAPSEGKFPPTHRSFGAFLQSEGQRCLIVRLIDNKPILDLYLSPLAAAQANKVFKAVGSVQELNRDPGGARCLFGPGPSEPELCFKRGVDGKSTRSEPSEQLQQQVSFVLLRLVTLCL